MAAVSRPGRRDDDVATIDPGPAGPAGQSGTGQPHDTGDADPLAEVLGETPDEPGGAISVLRRALGASPQLVRGIRTTVGLALLSAGGKVAVPVLIQQVLDRGLLGPDGFRPGFVWSAVGIAAVVVLGVMVASRATYVRLVAIAESTLADLRERTFAHIHRLSIADLDETRRGVLTSRVTSDIETIARFAQWGAVAWIVNPVVIVVVLGVLALYAWQLTVVVVAVLVPMLPALRYLQRRQLAAYDRVRTQVGETLTAVSEAVMGAPVVRAYGLAQRTEGRLGAAIDRQYRAETRALRFVTGIFSMSDLFGGLVVGAVVFAGVTWGASWGLDAGSVVASIFLVTLIIGPITELNEVLDQTQTAVAGWRKVLDVLDTPPEVVDPEPGVELARGALSVEAVGVGFAYRGGPPVLVDIGLHIASGTSVAVVGETGSGKTTFAKLLVRLADPTTGELRIGGAPLGDVAADSRRARIRMVPQDGFLFDLTVGENVRLGRPGASDSDVLAAFDALDLQWWVDRLPAGLDTPAGERGEQLSVGERQLVALARAQLADPGLLILDEATSAVDPETEQALTSALVRLAEGRTTLSVAHRLSTAERAELILVFDGGRIVERGAHHELVAADGRYAELYRSWLGSTRDR
ncbi:MAG: ABC transporter ATP-binding protein [Acidimicrobiia bacterium]|nr:ABC transporter ATP-binding protein [Acidimicrobiia bacterium]